LKTLISTALDSDTLYDLPDEDFPKVAPPKGRERGLIQPNKGRTVSLGAVWEYHDDEDLQYGVQGAGIEDHIPKKRKAVALKRSKSIKATSKTLSEFWEDGQKLRQTHTQHDEQQDSQLTTPPDSGKKGRKEAVSLTLQSKAKKTKPFKNPTITKPSVARDKEFQDDIPSSKPISTHQGWTTTEDTVKLMSNGIAKTTLDKLAAFRYKSYADPLASITLTNSLKEHEVRSDFYEGHKLPLEPQETGHPSSHLGPFLNRNSSSEPPHSELSEVQFDDALEGTEVQDLALVLSQSAHGMPLSNGNDRFFTDTLWNFRSNSKPTPSNSQNAVNRAVDESQVQQHLQPKLGIEFDQSLPKSPQCSIRLFPETSNSPTDQTQQAADSFEPTSSEARVFCYLLDSTGINEPDQQSPERSELETPAMQNDTRYDSKQGTEVDPLHEFEVLGSFHPTGPDFGELPPQTISYTLHQSKIRLPASLIEVQVERSDVETVPRDVSKGSELDEFDEGVDENDLLAMVSEGVVPDTQLSLSVKFSARKNHGARSQIQIREPALASAQNGFASSELIDLTLEVRSPYPGIGNHRAVTPPLLSSELGDEYQLDERNEEIFKMAEIMNTGVIEQFQAPESLQFAFGDDPSSGEVYDSSLQFSPPKHQGNPSSPRKVPSDLHTDKNSTGDSRASHSDTELLPVSEEEDCNFIRSSQVVGDAEVLVISEAFSDPQRRAVTGSLDRGESPFSPQPRASTIESEISLAPASATQTDFALIMRILDDSHEYQPLRPFARPDFPMLVRDHSPIIGISAQAFLRVCFRIGELFKEGARCEAMKQDAVIELFARVTFSSREPETTKQHFQFADLWHDRPPFPNGVLANYKTTGLVESESKAFLGADERTMARCLGSLKRGSKGATGWMLHIINIRTTDWEEIKWAKRVVSAGVVKSESMGLSRL
jgi:hypothetical protein